MWSDDPAMTQAAILHELTKIQTLADDSGLFIASPTDYILHFSKALEVEVEALFGPEPPWNETPKAGDLRHLHIIRVMEVCWPVEARVWRLDGIA
jgi:hypothetical protein